MKKSTLYIIIVGIIAIAAMIFIYQSIPDVNELAISEYTDEEYIDPDSMPVDEDTYSNPNLGREDKNIDIKASYSNKIVYGSNSDLGIEELRDDCQRRGGTFNECGSACGPEAEGCIEVCTYTCEIDRDTSVKELNVSEIDWKYYYSKNFKVGFDFLPSMNIEKNQDGSVSFLYFGDTQGFGTEVYDGIVFTVNRVLNRDDLSIREYTETRFDENEIATVADEISEYTLNDISGYSYSLISAGTETTYIFLPLEDDTILEIRYIAADPGDEGYQDVVDHMLDSMVIEKYSI
ncbi:MAG: hypothetical protein ACLFNO_00520 [Parcubacteria group bacterium]